MHAHMLKYLSRVEDFILYLSNIIIYTHMTLMMVSDISKDRVK